MRKVLVLVGLVAASIALAAQAGGASAAGPGSALVTNTGDAGPGSFRAAVELATANPSVGHIVFVGNLEPIALAAPVVYTGSQSLDLVGNGAVLEGDGFRAETGGDLSVIGLTIRDAPGEGLAYEAPAGASGTKEVSLNGVTVAGSDGHGVLINDQADPEDTSNPYGSAASLAVSVIDTTFDGNGFGALDRDGLRVNEGGAGNLSIVIRNTVASDNGADGIELDERGDGDAVFAVSGARITGNGSFDVTETDLDDGMDVDESGAGALLGWVLNSVANDNLEEGWDFNENHAGDFLVEMTNVEASGNLEEGVDFEEDDDFAGGGDLATTLVGVTTDENAGGDGGLKIREKGDGSLDADIRNAQANGNETDGIHVREDAAGSLAATVDQSTANDNAEDGINFDENSSGNLAATVGHGSSSNNGDADVLADQGGTGVGTLDLLFVAIGDVVGVNVAVTQKP